MVDQKPNFLIIVADDLGFTDIASFGGEIDIPNLDKLAGGGFRFTGFHTASACSPTRSMLFSGTDNHLAGLGQMAEFAKGFPEKFKDKPGYEGYLNFRVAALPEILSPDYYTLISGKWHLGLDEPYWPDKRGFEQSFTLLPGAGNHYKFATDEEHFMPFLHTENGRRVAVDKELPENFYSTEYFTTKFLHYLKDEEKRQGRPFFGCLTYIAPHWPLQAPKETRAKYRGKYDSGPLILRKQRLERAKKLGIVPDDAIPHLVETHRDKTWDELDPESQKYESKIVETYAAMVKELDKNIGRVIEHSRASGELDNTFIVFMSDNGAEGMLTEALPFGGKTFGDKITKRYNNTYENIGNGDSFVFYGDLWAQAATAPNYMYKMWASEGGINCPLILHYPKLAEKWTGDRIVTEFTTVMDILPTVLELSHVPHPGETFKGRKVHTLKGVSWAPYLTKENPEIHSDSEVVGWELFGQRAIRQGPYKALYVPKPFGDAKWDLFNIDKDPGETTDLSDELPEKLEEMIDHWSLYVSETGVVDLGEYPKDVEYKRTIIHGS